MILRKSQVVALGFFLFSANGILPSAADAKTEFLESARNSFFEKSTYLITKLEDYHRLNKKYASPIVVECYRVIGLDARLWSDTPFEGLIYDPKGDTLEVRPAKEFTIFVADKEGTVRILSYNLHWSLIYNLKDKNWYFHRIAPEQCIDISTIHIKRDKPYKPLEYR